MVGYLTNCLHDCLVCLTIHPCPSNFAQGLLGEIMFEIEKYKKPTDWSQVALWVVSITALVVVALDLFVWRA